MDLGRRICQCLFTLQPWLAISVSVSKHIISPDEKQAKARARSAHASGDSHRRDPAMSVCLDEDMLALLVYLQVATSASTRIWTDSGKQIRQKSRALFLTLPDDQLVMEVCRLHHKADSISA